MTVYSPNIPQPTDRPSDSQANLLLNFQALKFYLDKNHVPILDPTTNADEGKHKFLQMPEQVAAPATLANEGGLYVKEASSIANLFWRQESNGTEIQLTNIAPSLGTSGYTFLPGGILIQWGTTVGNASPKTVSYPIAFSTVYKVVFNLRDPGGFLDRTFNLQTIGNVSFAATLQSPAASIQIDWIAIGQKV